MVVVVVVALLSVCAHPAPSACPLACFGIPTLFAFPSLLVFVVGVSAVWMFQLQKSNDAPGP